MTYFDQQVDLLRAQVEAELNITCRVETRAAGAVDRTTLALAAPAPVVLYPALPCMIRGSRTPRINDVGEIMGAEQLVIIRTAVGTIIPVGAWFVVLDGDADRIGFQYEVLGLDPASLRASSKYTCRLWDH